MVQKKVYGLNLKVAYAPNCVESSGLTVTGSSKQSLSKVGLKK